MSDESKPRWADIQRYIAFAIVVGGMVYSYAMTMDRLQAVDTNVKHRIDALELKVDSGVATMKQYAIDDKERRRMNAFLHANSVSMVDCRRCMGGR